MTRGEKVIAFIERYCRVPEGAHVGKPLRLMSFQKRFIIETYDNPVGTSRAYLSMARKNGKSALIAAIVLAHIDGPEARNNSQIICGARSREQASIIYNLAEKMVNLNPVFCGQENGRGKRIKTVPSSKRLIGLIRNVEFRAISAEAPTAHGLSPVVAILDEVGQVKGPRDAFVEAVETAQGAHDDPLLLAVSTQAATDADLFSVWIDHALSANDPRIVCHLYAAPADCDLFDREAWEAANPALGEFRSLQDLADFAKRASEMPASENSFRWLFLNQRVTSESPFVSKTVWQACGAEPAPLDGLEVYAGLDLSAVNDLTAFVPMGKKNGVWHVRPTFWLPADGLREKAKNDRFPYDVWVRNGDLLAAPGKSVDYRFVASYLRGFTAQNIVRKIAFDRWGFKHLRPWLVEAGFSEQEIESVFVEFGQGFADMSPALRELEADLLNKRVAHGNHPVLSMCAANAVVRSDPAGNRKLDKSKSTSRIDGMVAFAMARGVAPLETADGVYRGLYSEANDVLEAAGEVAANDSESMEWDPDIISDMSHPLFAEHKARFERWEALNGDV